MIEVTNFLSNLLLMNKYSVVIFATALLAAGAGCKHQPYQSLSSATRDYNTGINGLYTVSGTEHFYNNTVDTVFPVSGNCIISTLSGSSIEVKCDRMLSSSSLVDTLYYRSTDYNLHVSLYTTEASALQTDSVLYNSSTRSVQQYISGVSASDTYSIRCVLKLN